MEEFEATSDSPYKREMLTELNNTERWVYIVTASLTGRSGIAHKFQSVFIEHDGNRVIPCMYLDESDENVMSALTYFNAHSEDIGAYRKFVMCTKALRPEERLLASSLGLETFEVRGLSLSHKTYSLLKPATQTIPRGETLLSNADATYIKANRKKRKYRDRTQTTLEVLSFVSADPSANLPSIIFKCNLNYNSARSILGELLQRELIRIRKDQEDKEIYSITEIGLSLMERLSFYKRDKAYD